MNFPQQVRKRLPINQDLFDAAISWLEDSGQWEVHQALGWKISTQWKTRKPHDFGHCATFYNEDGQLWQLHPQHPACDYSKAKSRKRETPKGNGSRAYLPAIDVVTRQAIGKRYGVNVRSDSAFWDFVVEHPELPIVLTEGSYKALAALDKGYICISLYGVNAGVSKYETIAGERIRKAKPELIFDLQRFAVRGRRFILAFDQDTKASTRNKVNAALADLSWHLEQVKCDVDIATWDNAKGQHKGLDDLIFSAGMEAWDAAYDEAIPATQWRIQNELARAVKRKPDLDIGDQEFSEVADQLPKQGLVVLHGGKGTAKSKAIAAMLKGRKWISSTPLVSLGRDQAESWGGVFINDGDLIGSQLLKDGAPVDGASVCIPSLLKVRRVEHDVLVVDEASAHSEFLLNSKLANKQGIRALLISEHHRQVQYADLTILADADMNEDTIHYYEEITGQRAFYVRSSRKPLNYEANILKGSRNQAVAALMERVDEVGGEKLIYIHTDAKALAKSLARLLESQGIKSLLITSDTSGGADEARFIASKGAMIPELLMRGTPIVIASPSITQGASFEQHTDKVDSFWGFYSGCSISAHGIAQSPDRIRSHEVLRFLHIENRGTAYSKLSKAQTAGAFCRELKQLSTASARLVRLSLTPETQAAADRIDWQNHNIKMLASLEVRRNRGMMRLRDTVIALLRHEGKQVKMLTLDHLKAAGKDWGKAWAEAAKAVKREHAEAIAKSPDIDEAEADRLSSQTEAITPEQALQLEKHYLRQFYRCDVSADLVMLDRTGRARKQIRNLERVLDKQKAIEHTAKSIECNPESPQDWSRAAVQEWLIEQSGADVVIREIVAGEINVINAEINGPIADFVREHLTEFRIGFGFNQLDKISDQQILGQLLNHVGIKTTRNSRQNTYRIIRSGEAGLDEVLAIIERRRQTVTPPSNQIDESGGCHTMSFPKEGKFNPQESNPIAPVPSSYWEDYETKPPQLMIS